MSSSRRVLSAFLIAGSAMLTGCVSVYVDTATKEIPVAAMKKVSQPQAVQVTFEFQTRGAPNAAATKALKDEVLRQVADSGLFAPLGATAPGNAAMMTVTINNVPMTDNAFGKGFVTGLTFGLAGTSVSDGYVCTVNYLPLGQAQPIVTTARHAIHTTVGIASAPANGKKLASNMEAVHTMTREILSNALSDLSQNTTFNKGSL